MEESGLKIAFKNFLEMEALQGYFRVHELEITF